MVEGQTAYIDSSSMPGRNFHGFEEDEVEFGKTMARMRKPQMEGDKMVATKKGKRIAKRV